SESLSLLLNKIVHEDPISPSAFNSAIHRDIDIIILKALQKSRSKRYQTAQEFALDLERFLNGYPVLAKAPSHTALLRKWGKKNRISLLLGSLIGTSLLISFFYFYWERYTRQKSLFDEKFQQAQYEQKKVSLGSENSSDQNRKNLQHLLYAFNNLNESLSVWPGEKKAELQKWEIGKQLIALACQEESYQFAEYVQREMRELLNVKSVQKEELVQWIENKKYKQSRIQKKKLEQWIQSFRQSVPSKEQQIEAVFEISKMKSPEILESLQKILDEGTNYFFSTTPPYTKSYFYLIVVSALGRIGNPKVGKNLIQSLEKIAAQLSKIPPSQRAFEKIKFMVVLVQALEQSQTLGAANILEKILWKMGENDAFWDQTERIYCRLAHRDKVDQILPKTMEEYYKQSFLKYLQKQYKEALIDASQAVKMGPNVAECYILRGLIKEALQDYLGALKDYSDAIPLNPYQISIYINRGTVLMTLQEFEAAHEDFSRVIQMDPLCTEAYLNRGYNWHNRGDFQRAITDLSEAIRLNPYFEKAYINRAVSREMLHDYEGAIEDTTLALRLNSASSEAYLNRGNARFKKGDAKEALADFQQTLYLNPHFIDGYLNRGIVKQAIGDIEGAINDYTEAIQIKPRADIYYTRAILRKSLGKNSEAHQDFKKYLELTENTTDPKIKILRNFVRRELQENSEDK
ncbi:MAG: tetratricopeptide repeat protein, partial [Planctomycetota bacterium]